MTKLVMRLLGGYQVELDGEAVYDFRTDKARALLAYLVVEADRPHRRETLAGLLWPERPDAIARTNLRQALWCLRAALHEHEDPPFLFVTPTDVQFNTASDYVLDVAQLEAFARSAVRHTGLLPDVLCADFLAGFAVSDSEAFQEWLLDRQEHCHRLAIEILDEQSANFEETGDYGQAAAAARLQVRLEPWLEEAHRRYMRALALAGRRDEALHQYELCRRALESELGVEPSASTEALREAIQAEKLVAAEFLVPGGQRAAGSRTRDGPGREPDAGAGRIKDGNRLRAASIPARLVARDDELGQLARHLDAALAGETGVAFVSGDAGSGKTALLEAFAASAMVQQPELLVAGARCSPGDHLNPFVPLRKLAEVLFGDPGDEVIWQLGGGAQADRLQRASGPALAALGEHGLGLVDTLVPAASVARRAGAGSAKARTVEAPSGRTMGPSAVAGRPAWLGEPGKGPKPAAPLSQDTLFGQLLCTLAAIARERPLLLLFDDLHWVDEASAAFLLRLGRELSGSRLLVLGAYRSATVALGRRDPRSGEVMRHPLAAAINELRRARGEIVVELDRTDGRAFVEAFVDSEPNRLGAHFRDALYAQTGGHALFTVETLRNLQERGELYRDEAGRWAAHESLDWGSLAPRVEAAIAERIERLPEIERRILSCASAQGDDFTAEMAAEPAGMLVSEVLACLSGSLARQHHLVRAQGAQRVGSGRHSIFRFTHHLFQKYLYDALDPIERMHLHGVVAAALDRQAGSDPGERERLGARLAWHYEAGGLPLSAARALLDAGRQAMRVSAFREALDRFDHGLALLRDEPPSPDRTDVERLLGVARLGPLRCLEGIGGATLHGTLARATEAWADYAEGWSKLTMLMEETERLLASMQFEDALAAAEHLLAEAAQQGQEEFAGVAHSCCGISQHHLGNPRKSEESLDQAAALLTGERRAEIVAAIGVHGLAGSLAYSALNQWFLGYPDKALARSRQAIATALAEGTAFEQATAMALGAYLLFLLRGEGKALAEHSEQCRRLCLEQGMGMWQGFVEVLLGRSLVMRGDAAAGIERMRAGIAAWQAKGMVIGSDYLVVVLADSCLLAAGRRPPPTLLTDIAPNVVPRSCSFGGDGGKCTPRLVAAGLAAIDPMLGPSQISCCQLYEPELRRLRGELLLARDGLAAAAEALACFERALQLGHDKGALAWELRAAMSLVRLRERQLADAVVGAAELAEARNCLAGIYARFTEGFAFPDLQNAAGLTGNRPRRGIGETS